MVVYMLLHINIIVRNLFIYACQYLSYECNYESSVASDKYTHTRANNDATTEQSELSEKLIHEV